MFLEFRRAVRAGAFVTVMTAVCPALAQNQIVMVDDFSEGVLFATTTQENKTWTPTLSNNGSVAAADNYYGSEVMKITDPGGSNGVYAIYPDMVPATGDYTLRCSAKFIEYVVGSNLYDAYANYQIMLTLNGSHRVGLNPLVTPTIVSPVIKDKENGLNQQDQSNDPPITLATSVFQAQEGDDLCISFGTWSKFDGTAYSKGGWNGSYILIDNIELVPYPEPENPETPVSLSGWELE